MQNNVFKKLSKMFQLSKQSVSLCGNHKQSKSNVMTQTNSNTQVNTILAKYKGNPLHEAADSCNRGTTSDVRFYTNGDTVSVYKIYGEMSEKEQKEHLSWFLSSRTFEYIK